MNFMKLVFFCSVCPTNVLALAMPLKKVPRPHNTYPVHGHHRWYVTIKLVPLQSRFPLDLDLKFGPLGTVSDATIGPWLR